MRLQTRSLPALVLVCHFLDVLAFSGSAPAAASERYEGPIIDMHMHAKWQPVPPRRICNPGCEGAPTVAKSIVEVRAMTIAAMERNNIVLGMISETYPQVLEWVEGHEHRFLVGISTPSTVPIEVLRELHRAGKLQAMGEINEQYLNIPIDDPRLDPVFALAEELDLPTLLHVTTGGGGDDFPSELGHPLKVARVIRKHPRVRVYLENAGWPFLDEITGLMYQYPTVYVDVSTHLHIFEPEIMLMYLQQLMDLGLGRRIMFGSDQMWWPEVIDECIEVIQGADFLTPEQKADIFYNNAARFLRLTDEQIASHHAQSH